MNRKKILICLNGQEESQLETAFIRHQLAHPHHQLMKFNLESIVVSALAEAGIPQEKQNFVVNQAYSRFSDEVPENSKLKDNFNNQLNCKRQVVYSNRIKALLTESMYADLLLIRNANYLASCLHYGQQKPIRELLKKAGCPILVIPDQLSEIQQIALVYDGTPSSLAALKSMGNLLSPLCRTLPVTVFIQCREDTSPFSAQEEKMFIEYLRLHFKDLGIYKIGENSADTIHFAIDPTKKLLLVHHSPDHLLDEFLGYELEKLKLTQDQIYFLFLANGLISSRA